VDQTQTSQTISTFNDNHGYILDPHTAVGVKAGQGVRQEGVPMACLATAHPAKFGAAVKAAIGKEPDLPPSFVGLTERPSRCQVIAAEQGRVKAMIEENGLC